MKVGMSFIREVYDILKDAISDTVKMFLMRSD